MSFIGITAPLEQALDYHMSRHNLLSANLAHVDTPGYKAQELYRERRVDFDEVLGARIAAAGHQPHVGSDGRDGPGWRVAVDPNAPVRADGNGVDLDREAVKIAANNLRYDAVATLVQGELAMLDYAARDGR
jgi:flagellar basal-body rod protein FlgB